MSGRKIKSPLEGEIVSPSFDCINETSLLTTDDSTGPLYPSAWIELPAVFDGGEFGGAEAVNVCSHLIII
jgi:hypothetical protein